MSFHEFVQASRTDILHRWVELTLRTYPADAFPFFSAHHDQFANPVGETIKSGLTAVFDSLVDGADAETLREKFDRVIRIRSVQNFSAAEAVGFVFGLKGLVRKALGRDADDASTHAELVAFDSRVDELALIAFDIFMSCREQVYDIRAREEKARSAKLLDRARQIVELHATGQKITRDDITPLAEGGERQ